MGVFSPGLGRIEFEGGDSGLAQLHWGHTKSCLHAISCSSPSLHSVHASILFRALVATSAHCKAQLTHSGMSPEPQKRASNLNQVSGPHVLSK